MKRKLYKSHIKKSNGKEPKKSRSEDNKTDAHC